MSSLTLERETPILVRVKELGHWTRIKAAKRKNDKIWCQQACGEMGSGGQENCTDLLQRVIGQSSVSKMVLLPSLLLLLLLSLNRQGAA